LLRWSQGSGPKGGAQREGSKGIDPKGGAQREDGYPLIFIDGYLLMFIDGYPSMNIIDGYPVL